MTIVVHSSCLSEQQQVNNFNEIVEVFLFYSGNVVNRAF